MDHQSLILEADRQKLEGNHEEAIKICNTILHHDLNCLEAFEELGDNYLSLREYSKAKKALERAISIDPNSANANYLLGFTHSALGNWKKSVGYLEMADELQANHPEILRCLGWSVFHFGQRKKGIILLERALTMSADDVLVMCDLAVCYMNDRNFARSINLLRHALAIDPQNQKAKECLETALFFEREYTKIKKTKES
ncbi:tetratricopeptide repeat protein [Candidatus Peregrinibacteria bacterium]|jgi:tetratricopeptide (TPR) repeat protein|nr:tetratricopeptide repeat protein [Candidatus Peregrinibacteria bacterium]MBT7484564.1 tetratricopeptide repeat protein [Candidatus Peregrinibacteria bacterium]MBT7703606.1 tetratricopeptide repeat protein [Candidatus Peregrinibacteria bacterium]